METLVHIGGTSPPSTLYAENSFGNIYVNKVSSKGAFPPENDPSVTILYNKIQAGGNTADNTQDYINLSR